jgi:hypothetical protein
MEGAVRKSRNGRSSEEEQEWKEQWERAGMEGAMRKSRNGRNNEEEQVWKEQ